MTGNEGLNAATGEYEDLVKLGVIDAAKVTRSALQNAASIAALFLTTEVVIVDKPEAACCPHGRRRHGLLTLAASNRTSHCPNLRSSLLAPSHGAHSARFVGKVLRVGRQ